ncbi:hypothetical protein PCA31118_04555 [Pandoraea captiosa]|uniref:Capsular biosynthesis protein n=1 Tax=Pandoraea captiosa TaxID=2508302 RepID=A0A5E5ALP3_9BURK|nr:capsular biosynthesis protein [Pandoraea captiosa]VVE73485.1 hypothetical protein PCA31118_04555 [Pandoraea captiosa]
MVESTSANSDVTARDRAASRGPIGSGGRCASAWLSWFDRPLQRSDIARALVKLASHDNVRDVDALMLRVRSSQAAPVLARWNRAPTMPSSAKVVLLIDERRRQTRVFGGDRNNSHRAFARMVAHARAHHAGKRVVIVRTRDPGRGRWLSSHIDARRWQGVEWYDGDAHDYLAHATDVYTLASSEGWFGMLAGATVHVFGTPVYAGWGLSADAFVLPVSERPSLSDLFRVIYLELARYRDPVTLGRGTLTDVLDIVDVQRAVSERYRALDRVDGFCFARWKRPFATPYLRAGGGSLAWLNAGQSVRTGARVALWGARERDGEAHEAPPLRIEDGFLHSHGLGSDFIAPRSQVVDQRGMYFNPATPNDLTQILNETQFTPEELARARALRERIVSAGLTKYNLGRRSVSWRAPVGSHVVLVVGQVADDASIRLGTRHVRTAQALLDEVRAACPGAFIVYKPHPDVLSGNRRGLIDAHAVADVVDSDADIVSLIEASDEVHTLSSLTGFDALLRNKTVHVYGLPFYAGWGLTHDHAGVIPWRERELTLDMLVAGALLKYPLYFDWRLGLYTTPEAVVAQLAPRAARPLVAVRHSPARSLRKTRRWLRNVAMYFLTSLRDRLRSEAIYAPPPDAGASGHWRTDPPFFNDRDQSTK